MTRGTGCDRRGAWRILALAMLAAPVPALAAPMPAAAMTTTVEDPALDFAQAYLDMAIYVPIMRKAMVGQIDQCVDARLMSADTAAERRETIDLYFRGLVDGISVVHQSLADRMRPAFTRTELVAIDTFIRSPAGRSMIRLLAENILSGIGRRYSPCGLPVTPEPDQRAVSRATYAALSPADRNAIGVFAARPEGRKLIAFMPQLVAAMDESLPPVIRAAAIKAGLGDDFTA